MFVRTILTALLLTLGSHAIAEQTSDNPDDVLYFHGSAIFMGQLQKTILYPGDGSNNVETCGLTDEEGEEYCTITISNACGTEIIEFYVTENILGTRQGEKISLKTTIGEWCNYSVSLTMDDRIVFAVYQNEFPGEHSVYAFNIFYDENSKPYIFLEGPVQFANCDLIAKVDCYSLLKLVEPQYVGLAGDNPELFEEFQKLGIVLKNEKDEMFLVKAIFVEDLRDAIEKTGNQVVN